MKHELGLSNNVWNNPLTKDEKKSLKNNSLLFLFSFYIFDFLISWICEILLTFIYIIQDKSPKINNINIKF